MDISEVKKIIAQAKKEKPKKIRAKYNKELEIPPCEYTHSRDSLEYHSNGIDEYSCIYLNLDQLKKIIQDIEDMYISDDEDALPELVIESSVHEPSYRCEPYASISLSIQGFNTNKNYEKELAIHEKYMNEQEEYMKVYNEKLKQYEKDLKTWEEKYKDIMDLL